MKIIIVISLIVIGYLLYMIYSYLLCQGATTVCTFTNK